VNQIDSGPINFKNWFTVAQSQDKECNQITKSLENNEKDAKKKYIFEKGTLFRIITLEDDKSLQLLFFQRQV
jgi:hypothetical protein